MTSSQFICEIHGSVSTESRLEQANVQFLAQPITFLVGKGTKKRAESAVPSFDNRQRLTSEWQDRGIAFFVVIRYEAAVHLYQKLGRKLTDVIEPEFHCTVGYPSTELCLLPLIQSAEYYTTYDMIQTNSSYTLAPSLVSYVTNATTGDGVVPPFAHNLDTTNWISRGIVNNGIPLMITIDDLQTMTSPAFVKMNVTKKATSDMLRNKVKTISQLQNRFSRLAEAADLLQQTSSLVASVE